MQTGIVKWFNNAKGYGFILPDGGGADIFAHYSAIDMGGYKTLKAGQSVTFVAENGPKGLHAMQIRAAEAAPGAPPEQIDATALTDTITTVPAAVS